MVITELNENLPIESTDLTINNKMDMKSLLSVVSSLPEAHRLIVNLSLVENYSHKEISEMLGISESNSKSRLHKARMALKQKLEEIEVGTVS